MCVIIHQMKAAGKLTSSRAQGPSPKGSLLPAWFSTNTCLGQINSAFGKVGYLFSCPITASVGSSK